MAKLAEVWIGVDPDTKFPFIGIEYPGTEEGAVRLDAPWDDLPESWVAEVRQGGSARRVMAVPVAVVERALASREAEVA